MTMQSFRIFVPFFLALLAACSGGGGGGITLPPPPATRLTYADPTDPAQWRFVRNPASTSTHLMLDLVAPSAAAGRGVSLVMDTDGSKATWEKVAVGDPARARTAAYTGDIALLAKADGNRLRALASQFGRGTGRTYGSQPVLTVALDLVPGISPGPVAVVLVSAWHLDSASFDPAAISPALGTLKAE